MAAADAAPPALSARGLSFAYGRRTVLDGVDLDVPAGSVVGLAGPNGSGKSTLIRVLSGVLRRYGGTARVCGQELRQRRPRELARQIAVVPQEPVFGFPFSVLEIVLMGRHPHRSGAGFAGERDLALAGEALERCGIAGLSGRSVLELSAGERQRVLFARALCQRAPIVLLDEPTAFLDIRHQTGLYDVVREEAAAGRAVLTSLHDLNLAAEYCDRLCLLRSGRIAAAGAPAEVLTRARLAEVFEAEVHVGRNERTGRPLIVPLSARART